MKKEFGPENLPLRMKVFIIISSISTVPRFRIPEACSLRRQPLGSGIEVPSKDQDLFALKEVPHGKISQNLYFSKITNSQRRCFVYTPPDYDKNTSTRYPVLYLQHGMGEMKQDGMFRGKQTLFLTT